MDREQLHRARLRAGIGICTYEAIALAVDDPEIVPPLTWIGHRWRWIGWAMAAWCVGHLACPSFFRRLTQIVERWINAHRCNRTSKPAA